MLHTNVIAAHGKRKRKIEKEAVNRAPLYFKGKFNAKHYTNTHVHHLGQTRGDTLNEVQIMSYIQSAQ